MKVFYKKTLFYFVIGLLLIINYQSQGFSQNNFSFKETKESKEIVISRQENIHLPDGQYSLKVTVYQENSETEGLSMWTEWNVYSPTGPKKISCDLSSMIQVTDIKSSPNNKYLAILSVGEGHPILDIVDLQALLINQECKNITSVNPYPGIINIDRWKEDKLVVTSSVLLTHKIDEQYPIDFPTTSEEKFLISPENQEIKALSANAKNPSAYFIKLLSDKENKNYAIDVLGLLKSKEAIPILQSMLSKETDPEIVEKINLSIKKIID
jgi:hypothetical protein